jgi:hypothetical protein
MNQFGGFLGPGYLYGFTALAFLINFGFYFFSDRIVLAMHRAEEIAPSQAPALHGYGFRMTGRIPSITEVATFVFRELK